MTPRSVPMAVAAVLFASPVLGADIHVDVDSPSCSDTAPGVPLCTLAAAAARVAPGDTVHIHPGVYREPLESRVAGVEWAGETENPWEVKITASVEIPPSAISKTAGREHVYEFAVPTGETPMGIYELDRPTDVNRIPPAEFSLGEQDLNGSMEYWAWHTRAGCGTEDGTYDCPSDLAGALERLDAAEGTWYWDADTVYFHPRGDRDGTTLSVELAVRTLTVSLVAENLEVHHMSFYGNNHGDCSRTIGPGCDHAMFFGGTGTRVHHIETWEGRPQLDGSAGLDRFHLHHFFFTAGMFGAAINASGPATGFLMEDGEIICGASNQMMWGAPWGTPESPVVIQRVVFHEPEMHRWIGYWDWRTDTYLNDYGTHGPTLGDCGAPAHDIVFRNNVVYNVGDGVRVFGCQGGCTIVNNTINDAFNLMISSDDCVTATSDVLVRNNVFYSNATGYVSRVLVYGDDCWGIDADFNAYLGPYDEDGISEYVWACPNNDQHWAFDALPAHGHEDNGVLRLASAPGMVDPDPRTDGTGGDDYRLTSAADFLIDAGDPSICGHTPADGRCDIGAYEYGQDSTGPAPHRERARDVPPSPDPDPDTSTDVPYDTLPEAGDEWPWDVPADVPIAGGDGASGCGCTIAS